MNQDSYQPPPAVPGQPPPAVPQPTYGAPAPAPKSNKTLIIIVIVILVLLLCCCMTGGAFLAIPYLAGLDSSTTTSESSSMAEQARAEWDAWVPVPGDVVLDSPSPRQQAIAEEIIADRYPDFTLLETYVSPGGWSEADGVHYMDYYIVRIGFDDDPSVEVSEYFEAWTDASEEGSSEWSEDFAAGEGEEVGALKDGTGYLFLDSNELMHYYLPSDIPELLTTVAEEWPGALMTSVRYGDAGENEVKLSITTWEHYLTHSDFDGVGAVYSWQDGTWVLNSYHWRHPEDE